MRIIVDSIKRQNDQIYKTLCSQSQSNLLHKRSQVTSASGTASTRTKSLLLAHERARNTLINITNQMDYITYNDRRINEFLVEIHKKYSIPAACIVFIFIGAPLGIIARRGTFELPPQSVLDFL